MEYLEMFVVTIPPSWELSNPYSIRRNEDLLDICTHLDFARLIIPPHWAKNSLFSDLRASIVVFKSGPNA
jgi:hypothetical protein